MLSSHGTFVPYRSTGGDRRRKFTTGRNTAEIKEFHVVPATRGSGEEQGVGTFEMSFLLQVNDWICQGVGHHAN